MLRWGVFVYSFFCTQRECQSKVAREICGQGDEQAQFFTIWDKTAWHFTSQYGWGPGTQPVFENWNDNNRSPHESIFINRVFMKRLFFDWYKTADFTDRSMYCVLPWGNCVVCVLALLFSHQRVCLRVCFERISKKKAARVDQRSRWSAKCIKRKPFAYS